MEIMVTFDVPGMTREMYEALTGAMTPAAQAYGMRLHTAGPTSMGWRIVEIWPSREAFERFTQEVVAPMMAETGGPTPGMDIVELHNVIGLAA